MGELLLHVIRKLVGLTLIYSTVCMRMETLFAVQSPLSSVQV